MSSQDAAMGFAKKMFSAGKAAASALSAGVEKVRKGYANKHETGVLTDLRSKGQPPVELLMGALQRFYYLMMAGYKHEIQAVALSSAKRLTDPEKSTVPLDVITVLGGVLHEETLKYGDFQKKSLVQGMQDFLNKSRMGKDHYDRDSLAHDVYYAVLICAEDFDRDWIQMQNCFREAVRRTIERAASVDFSPDARTRAAKAIYHFGQAIKLSAQQAEERRQKTIKDAEGMLRAEQGRRQLATSASLPDNAGSSSYQNNQYPNHPASEKDLITAPSAPPAPTHGNQQYVYPSPPPYRNYSEHPSFDGP